MNKKSLITLIVLCSLLALILVASSRRQGNITVGTDDATTAQTYKLLGYYSTYQTGSTTCPVFVAPAGDIEPILENGYALHINGPATLYINPKDLPVEQQKILLASWDSQEWYVYLSVRGAGIERDTLSGGSCSSYVKLVSVVPMVPTSFNLPPEPYCKEKFDSLKPGVNPPTLPLGQLLTFNDPEYGFSFQYPIDWSIRRVTSGAYKTIYISKENQEIAVSESSQTNYGGKLGCNPDDYHLIQMGNTYIARLKTPETYEESGQMYLNVCTMSDNGCDFAIKLGNDGFISVTYMTNHRNDSFDPGLFNDMDFIVSTIRPSVR